MQHRSAPGVAKATVPAVSPRLLARSPRARSPHATMVKATAASAASITTAHVTMTAPADRQVDPLRKPTF